MHDYYSVFATKGGWLGAVFSDKGLYLLTLPCETENQANTRLKREAFSPAPALAQADMLREELERYFAGEKVSFRTVVDWSGYTPFQHQVLAYTAAIPHGQAVAYGDVAKAIGKAKACRAVGQALHINRTPIVVPCHRVLAGGGRIGGFGGGTACKQKLLDLEGIMYRI